MNHEANALGATLNETIQALIRVRVELSMLQEAASNIEWLKNRLSEVKKASEKEDITADEVAVTTSKSVSKPAKSLPLEA